jgi:hypothetical protein
VGRFDVQALLVCRDREELVETVMGDVRSIRGVRRTTTFEVIEVTHHVYHWVTFAD